MGENSPISSVDVCGHVCTICGVGSPENQRQDSKGIRGVNTVIRCEGGRLKGSFDGFHRPEGGQRADAIVVAASNGVE